MSQEEVVVTTTLQKPLEVLVSGNQLEQGDTLVVMAENLKTGQKITGKFDNKSFDFLPTETKGKLIGIIGIDVRKTPGDYLLKVLIDGEEKLNKSVPVASPQGIRADFFKEVSAPPMNLQN